MKRLLALVLLALLLSWPLAAGERLTRMISEKKWADLAPLFADESYRVLEAHFQKFLSIEFGPAQDGRLIYKVKFPHAAEIGDLFFDRRHGLYAGLKIGNRIAPIFFIDRFKKYAVENLVLHVGDATVSFDKGFFYQAWPVRSPLFFEGQLRFQLSPGDEEERLTLERLFKNAEFSQRSETGILILQDLGFLKGLDFAGDVPALETRALLDAYDTYRKYFGISVPQFKESWFLPVPGSDNLLIFARDKDSHYVYDFNSQVSPDTLLLTSKENKIMLSYDALKNPKPPAGADESLRELDLSLFCNPEKNFVSGTARLVFASAVPFRTLNLASGLRIRANIDLDAVPVSAVRKNESSYLIGPERDRLTFYYSGRVSFLDDYSDWVPYAWINPAAKKTDQFFFLSRSQNFYPNPGNDFFASSVTVNLPAHLHCLASGILLASKPVQDRVSYQFASPGTKGVSLVSGDFKKIARLNTKVPVNIYAGGNFLYERFITQPEMAEAIDFLVERFGALDMPEINVLFRRMPHEGGISHQGFVVLNIAALGPVKTKALNSTRRIRQNGPLVLSNKREDFFLHEMAHQWWGGMISWESYRDVWVTEGFATLASVLYLQKKMPASRFDGMIGRLKHWVFKNAASGPLAYGQRITDLERGAEAFQSVVYLKSALVLLMLKDMLGEENFFARLRGCLEKFKYKSVTSAMLIDEISRDEKWLRDFFAGWVFSRKIPEVSCRVRLAGKTAELSVTQRETAFVFPLQIRIETEEGGKSLQVIVKDREQTFLFHEAAAFKTLGIDAGYTPILIRDGSS